ncbi:MAG: Rid family hydrolase, partial [Myxococcota bacterium]
MERKPISTPRAPAAVGPYSQAIQAGGLVFCSGQIALDPDSGELSA